MAPRGRCGRRPPASSPSCWRWNSPWWNKPPTSPTNHLDLETTQWLEQYLAASERTVLLVSHDRAFLSATVDHVLHFEGGTATPYSAGYSDFVAQRAERRLAQERAFEQQQRTIA